MRTENKGPFLGFLWRSNEITSAAVEAARATKTRVILDISSSSLPQASTIVTRVNGDGGVLDFKISPNQLLDPSIEGLLEETDIRRLWVELLPFMVPKDLNVYLSRMAELSKWLLLFPVVGNVEVIARVLEDCPNIENLAIKGSEASGFVSKESAFTLFSSLPHLAHPSEFRKNVFVWGGIATPEAAATFLSAGAMGIVFESLHWLTDLFPTSETFQKKLSKLQLEHTDLVGLNVRTPCRLFNKGNSQAVKKLKQHAASLCGEETGEKEGRLFADHIATRGMHPVDSTFRSEELIPLGVEAAFARSFIERFGHGTQEAITGFVATVSDMCQEAEAKTHEFSQSEVAEEIGTKYPFIQGAMSCITDVPEFARAVSDAGGLPTIALGVMSRDAIRERLESLPEVMEDRPYAVNVVVLAENPFRDEQLAWIVEKKPRFAVISAGHPAHGRPLLEAGIEVFYIAPNEALISQALETGIRYIICEGSEAGGHIGEHSTLTMAQIVHDLRARNPELLQGCRVILAGGICSRTTAFMAAMLGADGVQMGTAYLATREIVATRALSGLYQRMIVESRPGGTVITGEGVGLKVRSLHTPSTTAICALERAHMAGAEKEDVFRKKMETLTVGSLLVAARGVDSPGGTRLDEAVCLEQGQFMSGACAGLLNEVKSLEALHIELAEAPFPEGLPVVAPFKPLGDMPKVAAQYEYERSVKRGAISPLPGQPPARERIAITGIALCNALGSTPEEVWAASLAGRSGVIRVPSWKWDHSFYYDPKPLVPDKTYCDVGAFQQVEVSRKTLGVPPQDFSSLSESSKITLWLAMQALEDSDILASSLPRERMAALISQSGGEAAAGLTSLVIRSEIHRIMFSVKEVMPLPPETENAIAEAIKSPHKAIDDTNLLGRLGSSAAGYLCNRYGFTGPSFAVSAACATSLVALYNACLMIRAGIIDAAVVGGAEEPLTPGHYLEFSPLGALAGITQRERLPSHLSRPFDKDRDGFVLGEGGGIVVLERESLARQRGAKIHGYITGIGASNSNDGMVESFRTTQAMAIKASFADASYGSDQIDMVECHATSTVQGDVEEFQALRSLFIPEHETVLTAFKSQIGHTLGASGINSLIRGLMAMKGKAFPPNLNFEEPESSIVLENTGLLIPSEPLEWKRPNRRPRRFQVNAFGFGGSNYVVQVEEAAEDNDTILISPEKKPFSVEQETDRTSFPKGVHLFKIPRGERFYRVGVVAEDETWAHDQVKTLAATAADRPLPPARLRALAREGIFMGADTGAPEPVAFVFPGQGSHYGGMGRELYEEFPPIREQMDRLAELADYDLLDLLFDQGDDKLLDTLRQQPAIFTLEYAVGQYLYSLGAKPAAMAGNSAGELTALCLSGVYSHEDGFRIVNMKARCMDKAAKVQEDPGAMVATDMPLEDLKELLKRHPGVFVTNINSPQQVVFGGATERCETLADHLKDKGFLATRLPVSMAFHSPSMRAIRDELEAVIAPMTFYPPRIPVVSNTTRKPFPRDPKAIKKILLAHLHNPVYWLNNIQTLRADYDIKCFVEVGPRNVLTNLIGDSIEDADCIETCLPSAESLFFCNAVAKLYAKGHLEAQDRAVHIRQPEKTSLPRTHQVSRQVSLPGHSSVSHPTTELEEIVKREINGFVLESFGRFLKPTILRAIKEQNDPAFTEEKLDHVLNQMFPGYGTSITHATVQPEMSPQPASVQDEDVKGQGGELLEEVIKIIMDATGYEREEIEPDMDLREDLSIRSSRLPVIIDGMEKRFGIKVDFETFMGVRTVVDAAETISRVLNQVGGRATVQSEARAVELEVREEEPRTTPAVQSTKRMTFREVELAKSDPRPISLQPGDDVVILSSAGETELSEKIAAALRIDYGINSRLQAIPAVEESANAKGLTPQSSEKIISSQSVLVDEHLAVGLVFIVDDFSEKGVDSIEAVSITLSNFFGVLKEFLASSAKKMALLVHRNSQNVSPGYVLAEGVLGMFLSLAHEFPSVLFRTVRVDNSTEMTAAIRCALDISKREVEMVFRGGEGFTREGRPVPLRFGQSAGAPIKPDDVVVVSGGGTGVSFRLARSLIPLGCRLVFLGRTALEENGDLFSVDFPESASGELAESQTRQGEQIAVDESARAGDGRDGRLAEIRKNLEELWGLGADASYYSCDVTDPEATRRVVAEIVHHHGKIHGIVHGAGQVKDNFLRQMSVEDFSAVLNVKLLGAWNLVEAARDFGLRYFICLSSAAAIAGNPGQVNYTAGNRAMSALAYSFGAADETLYCKALMMPPIEGTGMAENPIVRAVLSRLEVDYVKAEEVAELFTRELSLSGGDDIWVMYMKSMPKVSTVRIITDEGPAESEALSVSSVIFRKEDFPLIDDISQPGAYAESLEAYRVFSQEKDLWISDHKPFKFFKHPLVSAVMALEAFMEAARLLHPHLEVKSLLDARFLKVIECPPGTATKAKIVCRTSAPSGKAVMCDLALFSEEISPASGPAKAMSSNYEAKLCLGLRGSIDNNILESFPTEPYELDTRPLERAEIWENYDNRTDLGERYRVLEKLEGTAPGAIRGTYICKQGEDFATHGKTVYQYPAYLLEALIQTMAFYPHGRDEAEERMLIPWRIGEMVFTRHCTAGEEITLEARITGQNEEGITWAARATDGEDHIIMCVKDVVMQWFGR